MTTNQTIDGVMRATAERIHACLEAHSYAESTKLAKELRALLDAPSEKITDLDAACWAEVLRAASESAWMPIEYMRNDWVDDVCRFLREGPGAFLDTEPAAQPHGEPVAHCLLRRNGSGNWVNDSKCWVDGLPGRQIAAECEKHPDLYRLRFAYAEQPAPVVVVLPERRPDDYPSPRTRDCWNACLDEVTRLNTK